jgi:hypothetical protein
MPGNTQQPLAMHGNTLHGNTDNPVHPGIGNAWQQPDSWRALTALNLADNNLGELVLPAAWSYGYHGDYSGGQFYKHTDDREMKNGTPEGTTSPGVIVIADAIKDMRALSLANVMGNHIGKEMLSKLQEIMRSKANLVSLCGIADDDATEVDLSGLGMDADDASILASELPDKGAISKLTFGDYFSLIMTTEMTEANFGGGKLESYEAQIVAAFLPKCM